MLNKEFFLKKRWVSSIFIIVVWIVVFMVLIPVNMLNLAESSAESLAWRPNLFQTNVVEPLNNPEVPWTMMNLNL